MRWCLLKALSLLLFSPPIFLLFDVDLLLFADTLSLSFSFNPTCWPCDLVESWKRQLWWTLRLRTV